MPQQMLKCPCCASMVTPYYLNGQLVARCGVCHTTISAASAAIILAAIAPRPKTQPVVRGASQ